jgi:hypothetical protein
MSLSIQLLAQALPGATGRSGDKVTLGCDEYTSWVDRAYQNWKIPGLEYMYFSAFCLDIGVN